LNAINNTPNSLEALEARLKSISHNTQALDILQSFAKNLGKTKARQQLFNANGTLVRPPIDYQELCERGLIAPEEDAFTLLQGDIVASDAAYFLGERLTDIKFAIASSTCDLVPNRRQYATLLRLQPIKADDPQCETNYWRDAQVYFYTTNVFTAFT
jgi:hypothetical protein